MKFFDMNKEPTEMDRVMENIAQVEGELQQRIFQLGQTFYEDNKNNKDIEPKYYTIIDLISKLDQNRKGFYKNKLRLEGQMMCENCGAVIPYGSMFCNVCGKKADERQADTADSDTTVIEKKCSKCGASLGHGSLFCTVCGSKVE